MPFPRLSKLTDALYPITFLDMLAFHGSCFKAILLQAGRMLVGLLKTNVTASPSSPTTLPPLTSAPLPPPSQYPLLSSPRDHLSSYFTLLLLPVRLLCPLVLSKPYTLTTSILTPKTYSGPLFPLASFLLPLTFPVCCLNSSLCICLVSNDQSPYTFP